MKTVFCFILVLFFSQKAFAQKTKNQILVDSIKAQSKQKIGLGMYVMSEEDNKTVMISKSGRYVVKGTVTDMWDGMQLSDVQDAPYPIFPQQLNIDDFTVAFGNPKGKEVIAYVSYSCKQCAALVQHLLNDEFLNEHHVRLVPLYNNESDKLVVNNIYCSADKQNATRKMLLNRDTSSIDSKCLHAQSEMNVKLANAQKIKALPSTFFEGENRVYLGLLDN